MNKHTPGQWNATKFNPVTGDIDDCYLYVEPGIAVIERRVKGRDQHDTANARLIAAAPDLLDALERMVKCAQKQNWNDHYPEELAASYLAIDRARGEA